MKQLFLIGAGLAMIIDAAGAASAMDEDDACQALCRSMVSGPNDTISVTMIRLRYQQIDRLMCRPLIRVQAHS